jgi:hypothetical protein
MESKILNTIKNKSIYCSYRYIVDEIKLWITHDVQKKLLRSFVWFPVNWLTIGNVKLEREKERERERKREREQRREEKRRESEFCVQKQRERENIHK